MAAGAAAVFLLIPYLIPRRAAVFVQAFAVLVFAGAASQFVFYGSTLVSMRLEGTGRRRFQIAVSFAVPAVLTLYFVQRAESFDPERAGLFRVWMLVPLAVIALVSWKVSDTLDREYPFRGFLIASAVFFVWCFMKEQGMYFDADDFNPDGGSAAYISEDRAQFAKETGEYAMLYPLYVITAYSALLARLAKRRREA